jgi:autophagy-related protein 27
MISEIRAISQTAVGDRQDWKAQFLRDSGSNSDQDRDGIRLFLGGGSYGGVKQQAIIEFVCNRDVEGTEGEWTPEDEYEPQGEERRRSILFGRDDDDDKHDHEEKQLVKEGAALKFSSYKHEKLKDPQFDGEVLRLEWTTKYACTEKRGDGGSEDQSGHWGFFTWLVVM